MTKPQDIPTSPVSITVTAKTNNDNDKDHHHCFEQKPDAILTFEVETDPSIDTINFVLWNLHYPDKPVIAEPSADWPVQNGQVTITIGPDPIRSRLISPMHLGPGPYCAALTASNSATFSAASASTGRIAGNAIHYYETWSGNRNCKYEK
jgi:hypothetical protein